MTTRRNFLNRTLGAVLAVSTIAGAAHSQSTEPVFLLDFVVLNDGQEIAARNEYEAKVAVIAARYDVAAIHSYDVVAPIAGPLPGVARVNVFEMPSLDALDSIFSDPDFTELDDIRPIIHDMNALTLYIGHRTVDNGPVQNGLVLVDLVVMADGYGDADRDAYEAKVQPIAAQYGATIEASFSIDQKMMGHGPDSPVRLNLWRLQDSTTMQSIFEDPAFQALEEERQKLFDFDQLSMWMAAPRG